jgi:hypothetical protein
MSYSFYIITLVSIIIYNYKTIIRLINKHGSSSKSFINITFTFIKPSFYSFILAASYNSISSMLISLVRLYYLISSSYTNRIFARIYI